MNLKLVVVFVVACLILAASAKPTGNKGNKGGKGNKKGKGGPEKSLKKLCKGIDDGTITNTDSSYDSVFTDLDPVCDDLLDFLEPETTEVAAAESRKGGKNTDAVKSLLGFCKQLDKAEKKGFPEDLATELSDIFTTMGPICDAAVAISDAAGGGKGNKKGKGGPEKSLAKLCKGIDDGTITNTDSSYDSVFTDLDPVCDDLLDFLEPEVTIAAEAESRKKKGNKGGKNNDDAVKSLLNFCKQLDKAETKGFPEDLETELSDIFTTMGPICDAAVAINEASKTTTALPA